MPSATSAAWTKFWLWRSATPKVKRKTLANIRLLLTDVDGVLTDGKLYHLVDKAGALIELKGVDTQDGMGLYLLAANGVRTGVISGRASDGFEARAKMLKMSYVIQGTIEKVPAFLKILKEAGVSAEETAFIGDDLPDLPVLNRAGFSAAPANARREVLKAVDYVAKAKGGEGALREIAEMILDAKGLWKKIVDGYSK